MRTLCYLLASLFLFASICTAQQSTFQDPLLDKLVGKWILQGTIEETNTTHDIVAEWVLGHQYVRLHEVSRDKDSRGQPLYEAIVFIGWDQATSQYACLWLDTTNGNGLTGQAVGHAAGNRDEIKFLFKSNDKSIFHTTFAYNRANETWQWLMDSETDGKFRPFARLKLTKAGN